VTIMSKRTSGCINNIYFRGGQSKPSGPYAEMKTIANTVAGDAYKTVQRIQYHYQVPVARQHIEISVAVIKHNQKDLEGARQIMQAAEGANMKTMEEIYARESILMSDFPDEKPIILQAFSIGDLAIAAIPAEVFVEIGLELKDKRLVSKTFSIYLVNRYKGYITSLADHRLW